MIEHTEIHDLAGSCVLAVRQTVSIDLDGTADTLPLLDHYARMVAGSQQEVVSLVAPMCGAYFGTVVQNVWNDATWIAPKDHYEQWAIEFARLPLRFNPVGVAVEVILKEQAAGWEAHFETNRREEVERALRVYGDVREDDYYTFAVRFEALEQVLRALTADSSAAD